MKSRQNGATVIEFAFVLMIFLTFMLGILDFTRLLFTWGAANEATRAGARFAVVCDNTSNEALVLAKMQAVLPGIEDIALDWQPGSCDPSNCEGVTVRITVLNFRWISPIAGIAAVAPIPMPTFSTYLPREVMRGDPNSGEICTS